MELSSIQYIRGTITMTESPILTLRQIVKTNLTEFTKQHPLIQIEHITSTFTTIFGAQMIKLRVIKYALTPHPGLKDIQISQYCKACTNSEFFNCSRSGYCIHQDLKCDGHPQCPDNEDEDYILCKDEYIKKHSQSIYKLQM